MAEKKILELKVEGMHCATCPDHVEQALRHVEGVEAVQIPGWRSNKATVTARSDVLEADLEDSVTRAGYRAEVQSRRPLKALPKEQGPDEANGSQGGRNFDLLVIGAGSGGFSAAIRGVELGYRVGLVGSGLLGGTCVNIGCVPSKALIRAAEAWHKAGHHPFEGVDTQQAGLDWDVVRSQKNALVAEMRHSKYADVLAAYPEITYIEGFASFGKDGKPQVGEVVYEAKRYLIATGARPRMIEFPGLEEAEPLNSTTLMELEQLPKSLIVLGGRAIALELGQTMARLGVEVLILQRSPLLVPEHEPEIGRGIKDYFEQEGIGVVPGVEVVSLGREGDERVVRARVMGQEREFRAEQILMALGRQANTQDLGLENVGVEVDERGAIIVDEFQQSSNPNIYAAGDVSGNPELVYVAAAGASIAVRNALNGEGKPLDLETLPTVIFSDPQIAAVGLTEAEARRRGYEVISSTVELKHVARAQAARDLRGFIKLVADADSQRLLGAHILAAEAGEVIQTATLAIKFGMTIEDLTDTLFPYLTQVEGLKLAAQAFTKDVSKLSCCA